MPLRFWQIATTVSLHPTPGLPIPWPTVRSHEHVVELNGLEGQSPGFLIRDWRIRLRYDS